MLTISRFHPFRRNTTATREGRAVVQRKCVNCKPAQAVVAVSKCAVARVRILITGWDRWGLLAIGSVGSGTAGTGAAYYWRAAGLLGHNRSSLLCLASIVAISGLHILENIYIEEYYKSAVIYTWKR